MPTASSDVFPFGRPVVPRPPSASKRRSLFVLGAYPSALHVRWTPPSPYRGIRAMAIDNEPEPFWTGEDENVRVAAWMATTCFDEERWGAIVPAGHLNGSSGVWVEKNVFDPLGFDRADAWVTDALDSYRCSKGLAARVGNTYNLFAATHRLPQAVLAEHPSEKAIIAESLESHRARLLEEVEVASPDCIVTLGNAALAVIRELLPRVGGADTRRLTASSAYGAPVTVEVGKRRVDLIPLAHPAAPKAYQSVHEAWRVAQHS